MLLRNQSYKDCLSTETPPTMRSKVLKFILFFPVLLAVNTGCRAQPDEQLSPQPAAVHLNQYIGQLKNKKTGMVTNHTARIGTRHLVDTLLAQGVSIVRIFAPEHGFRGDADAGETVKDGKDTKTGLPIISLYGANKKPTREQLQGLDMVVFDIQDVGARFYTYISTLHYVMEACAENDIPLMVLDRPNPNGHYTDGPVLDIRFRSFVGMHPIPIVHGLTVGELATMINGEKWLENGVQCDLTVIPCSDYSHQMAYRYFEHNDTTVAPSPNLRSDAAIRLYPSLCLFEPTVMSIGRGTWDPFTVIGSPYVKRGETGGNHTFMPQSIEGLSKHPKYEGDTCYGVSLASGAAKADKLDLRYLMRYYRLHDATQHGPFFTSENFFNKLAGNDELIRQIREGKTEQEIRASWEKDLQAYKEIRKKYLLYP